MKKTKHKNLVAVQIKVWTIPTPYGPLYQVEDYSSGKRRIRNCNTLEEAQAAAGEICIRMADPRTRGKKIKLGKIKRVPNSQRAFPLSKRPRKPRSKKA
jgi:hypothetical protein